MPVLISIDRVILPIRRFSLDDAQVSKAIPTLSDRQFIVAKEKLSSADEQLQRELFWYREHLLSCVKARWKEVSLGLTPSTLWH